jgi:putative ABC transport system ATP-binding protein
VFQAFNLVPTLTAEENICLPLTLSGRQPSSEVLDPLVSMMRLGDRMHHRPTELSGGQQQRVAVAQALVARPQVVFADEPTGDLDTRSGQEILGFLRSAVDMHHQSIVMVTHDPQRRCLGGPRRVRRRRQGARRDGSPIGRFGARRGQSPGR